MTDYNGHMIGGASTCCSQCGGRNVLFDFQCVWDDERNDWVAVNYTGLDPWCVDCDEQVDTVEEGEEEGEVGHE